jgi:hypothetical protein
MDERNKRALFKEALAQGTEGTTFSNAMLWKECEFQSQMGKRWATYPYYHEHVQAVKNGGEHLGHNVRQRNTA